MADNEQAYMVLSIHDWEDNLMEEIGKPKQHIPIFVSSTYEDLKPYRIAVKETLHQLETIVRGMEYFGSKPGSPVEECLKSVRSCKVYIGIFAMRYGSIDEKMCKSMTQLEYEEAQKIGLPTLIYLIDEENQAVFPKYVDTGETAKKLEELKVELKKRFTVSFFTTPEDLSRRISQDLPEVLERIGVSVHKEEDKPKLLDVKELYRRFKIRPRKYAGQEFVIEGIIEKEIKSVFSEDASALKLIIGDAIRRNINFPVLNTSILVIADGEMADWLEVVITGTTQKMKVRLLFGTYTRVDWSDDGPVPNVEFEVGVKLIEVIDK